MQIKKELMPFKAVATKQKYNIKQDDVIVVEKDNTVKFVLRVLIAVIKIIAYIILLALAFVGLTALILPDTREVLIYQANSLLKELSGLTGV